MPDMRRPFCICAGILFTFAGCVRHITPIGQFIPLMRPVKAIAWSSDHRLLAFGFDDGTVSVWKTGTGEQIAQTNGYSSHEMSYEPTGMAFSTTSSLLAFGGKDNTVCVWNYSTNEIRKAAGLSGPVLATAFSPDGNQFAVAVGGLANRRYTEAIERHKHQLPASRPSVVVEPMSVSVFNVETISPISQIDASGLMNIAFSPDLKSFAGLRFHTTSATTWPMQLNAPEAHEAEVVICSLPDGRTIQRLPALGWWNQFSPDSRMLRSGTAIWDVQTGRRICDVPINARAFIDQSRGMLIVDAGSAPFTLWPVVVTTTNVHLRRLDIPSGSIRDIGEFHSNWMSGIGPALENPASISPDGLFAVDRMTTLWRIPQ
jgi:WD40 repeat protein